VYRVQQDQRMCFFPICGGSVVRQVNRISTLCANGEEESACYVPRIDYGALGLDGEQVAAFERTLYAGRALVSGVLSIAPSEQFGTTAQLRVAQGWLTATDAEPTGTLYAVRDNGVRCIAAPCFSYEAATVNLEDRASVSDVVLAGVGATEEQLSAASQMLASGSLLVTGTIQIVPNAGPAGEGRALVATQLYLPVTGGAR